MCPTTTYNPSHKSVEQMSATELDANRIVPITSPGSRTPATAIDSPGVRAQQPAGQRAFVGASEKPCKLHDRFWTKRHPCEPEHAFNDYYDAVADKLKRALDGRAEHVPLTVSDSNAVLDALDDSPPSELRELCDALLAEHIWRRVHVLNGGRNAVQS